MRGLRQMLDHPIGPRKLRSPFPLLDWSATLPSKASGRIPVLGVGWVFWVLVLVVWLVEQTMLLN